MNLINSEMFKFNSALDKREVGAVQAVIRHTDFIYEELDKNNLVFSLYLDFKKAFDIVNIDILLHKLHFYGIRGVELDWFKSYLDNRRQYVNANGVDSAVRSICSIPQGSNLLPPPLLFLIFFNDFPNSTDYFKFILFTDDR